MIPSTFSTRWNLQSFQLMKLIALRTKHKVHTVVLCHAVAHTYIFADQGAVIPLIRTLSFCTHAMSIFNLNARQSCDMIVLTLHQRKLPNIVIPHSVRNCILLLPLIRHASYERTKSIICPSHATTSMYFLQEYSCLPSD